MDCALIPIKQLDLRITDEAWPFAVNERHRIEAYWAEASKKNPHIWNGDVLIGRRAEIREATLAARLVTTDFASVIAWRGLKHQDDARNISGMPGIITADGAMIFGVMADHTYNAGKIYPPGGSLDRDDIRADGTVDVLGSIARELKEETGLDAAAASPAGLFALPMERALTVIFFLRFPWTARELERLIQKHVEAETKPELKALWTVREEANIRTEMAAFAAEMARYFLANREALTGIR